MTIKEFIETLNGISQDVWGILLILVGGGLLLLSAHTHATADVIGVLSSIVGAGTMAFKGSNK